MQVLLTFSLAYVVIQTQKKAFTYKFEEKLEAKSFCFRRHVYRLHLVRLKIL